MADANRPAVNRLRPDRFGLRSTLRIGRFPSLKVAVNPAALDNAVVGAAVHWNHNNIAMDKYCRSVKGSHC